MTMLVSLMTFVLLLKVFRCPAPPVRGHRQNPKENEGTQQRSCHGELTWQATEAVAKAAREGASKRPATGPEGLCENDRLRQRRQRQGVALPLVGFNDGNRQSNVRSGGGRKGLAIGGAAEQFHD